MDQPPARAARGIDPLRGHKIHAEVRAHLETIADIAPLHRGVRPDVTFVIGGVHAAERLLDFGEQRPAAV